MVCGCVGGCGAWVCGCVCGGWGWVGAGRARARVCLSVCLSVAVHECMRIFLPDTRR